jgi:hypothetical protein
MFKAKFLGVNILFLSVEVNFIGNKNSQVVTTFKFYTDYEKNICNFG